MATEKRYPIQIVMDALRLIGYVVSKVVWFIRYKGLENIPKKSQQGFLIAANHQTYIDPVWICVRLRRKFRFMAIGNAFEWRYLGKLIRYLGAFPVSEEPRTAARAMKEAIATLKDGAVLTVFPEGARSFADGKIIPFKTGAVFIAFQAGVPILPVTISGGNSIWPQKQKYPNLFRRVTVQFHPTMEVVRDNSLSLRENLEFWTKQLESVVLGESRV